MSGGGMASNVLVRSANAEIYLLAKVVQTESRDASLLAVFAEVQPIFCKGSANREQRCKLACGLCRGATYLLQRY